MNHLETLKAYQSWRRDDTQEPRTLSEMGLSAMAIGRALDWAIADLLDRPSETEARKLAQQQLETEREEKRVRGLQLSAALNGDKRADEPENDGRLDAVRAMKRENDELRANVERLRQHLDIIRQIAQHPPMDKAIYQKACDALSETPAQSLAEVRAEYGRAGYVEGYMEGLLARKKIVVGRMDMLADKYAAAIREADKL